MASLRESMREAERGFILAALEANQWHMTDAAHVLGIERSLLYKKMRALGIEGGRRQFVEKRDADKVPE